MTDTFEYTVRPGSATLSVVAFTGLGALTAFLWQTSAGFALLFMIPTLAVCLWQLARVPTYGIRITPGHWHILGGHEEMAIPTGQISYLKIVDRNGVLRAGLMLVDGTEVVLSSDVVPGPLELIREATARGIPVREFS
ncbi:hypothetical protein [Hasllibacter sp. MH4015]|uniref:hypothetical protein n=1 Tax=Hasllibacter sp. MH4015 TaxID=2854029 RepID=UPI001CD2692C|nr:hypothetical protein [Hasllibacter sp. MH4015]